MRFETVFGICTATSGPGECHFNLQITYGGFARAAPDESIFHVSFSKV